MKASFRQALSKATDRVERTATQHRDAIRERDELLVKGEHMGHTQAELGEVARLGPGSVGAALRKHRRHN